MNKHIIRDPIYSILHFSSHQKSLLNKVIDTPFFQRLKRIKQMGLTDMIYPGATHNRFRNARSGEDTIIRRSFSARRSRIDGGMER